MTQGKSQLAQIKLRLTSARHKHRERTDGELNKFSQYSDQITFFPCMDYLLFATASTAFISRLVYLLPLSWSMLKMCPNS